MLFLLLGLSVGAVYAALTLGIVLTYQGTGVINFAAAAMAAVPIYVYENLQQGQLTLPIPWLPSFDIGGAPPVWIGILVALAVGALLGALVELGISRPLRTAPPLAKVVAAVGIMLTVQAEVGLKYSTDPQPRSTVLPAGVVKIGGAGVSTDRLWLIGIVVVLGAGLALWFRHSRTGLSIQAAADNERAASFARLSPRTLGMVTWVLATTFSSLIMVLAGPATGVLDPATISLLVVPALAGALIARLSSLWIGLAGALVLGVVQSELQFMSLTKAWWPGWAQHGLTNVVPFIIIVIALAVLGRKVPTRGDDIRTKLPPVILPRNRPLVIALLVAAGVVVLVVSGGTYRFGIITSLGLALIALSLVVLTGMVGQISLAQAAFAGVAGIMVSKFGAAIPFPFSMILAAVIAAAAGVVVGLPALRIRGAQLAVVTLAAALTLQEFVFANPSFVSATTDVIPGPTLFGWDLSVRAGSNVARLQFGLLVLAVVVVVFVLVSNLMRAGTGRKMLAVRSNERAAAAIGIDVSGIKLAAFGLSSFLAGLGGALLGYSRGQLSADSFGVFVGLSLLATGYLAGITSVSGALLAGASGALGIVYVFLVGNLHIGNYYSLLVGLGLILSVLFNPIGIAGKTRADVDRLLARFRRDRPVEPAAEPVEEAAAAVARTVGDVRLRAAGITVTYGGVTAVDDLSIEVRGGEIVGLIGANGAGKTSFIDAITGFAPCRGEVVLGGRAIGKLPPHQRARSGLARTWQAGELFEDLTVEHNVRVSDDVGHDTMKLFKDTVLPNPRPSAAVRDALALMSLTDVADRKPGELSLGRQRSLDVARALALQPEVLLLDEPAAGLDTAESVAFGAHLERIAATGVGCLLIDHDMRLVLGVCDRVYVIEFGRLIAVGNPEQVRRDPAVVASYLGAESQPDDDRVSSAEPGGRA
ncbi:branched-chain amino acid ABC transporter permease/ATP-binding protein [Amycolatopsis sp. GM8]|uniref:branched-chain amino acid ABC transporter permease/ATP-binding protein n=1 Tax=Amycolatopsis sp. GM8 TaxID=2896530 RepID=UPI001F00A201|nr:branched-chain amino acid ABC transporter permease/ATP-binding protein [Amycolatopsis sp. GM8]